MSVTNYLWSLFGKGTPSDPLAQEEKPNILHEKISNVQKDHLTTPSLDQFKPSDVYDKKKKNLVILSFDGGGVRGVIPLVVAQLMKLPFQDSDCFAGTSTGALIALGLTQMDIKEILNLYKNDMGTVFERSWEQEIESWDGLKGSIYSKEGLMKVLDKTVGDKKMSDTDKKLIIPSFNKTRYEKAVFTEKSTELEMKTVGAASASAPIYFLPEKIKGELYIDGEFNEQNPAQIAFEEILKEVDFENTHVFILSFGTGQAPIPKETFEQVKDNFIIENVKQLVDELLRSKEEGVMTRLAEDVNRYYPNVNYLRLEPQLEEAIRLDDATPQAFEKMEKIATKYFNELLEKGFKEKVIDPLEELFASKRAELIANAV